MFKNAIKEELKVPAHIDYLADLREFVTRIGNKHVFSDRVINAFKLAIDEAGTNIIRHAYSDTGGEGFITIRAIVKKDQLTICLIDQGKYFDPKHVKDPDLQRYVEIGKKGGLGIFVMRRLMDEIDYRKTEEGNELRLTKNRESNLERPKWAPLPKVAKAFRAIPFSLKAKYWLRTAFVLTLLASVGYFYYFLEAKHLETAEFFKEFFNVSDLVIDNLKADPQILEDHAGFYASAAITKLYADEVVRKIIYEIFTVDYSGFILGHTDSSKILSEFEMPLLHTEVHSGIFAYSITVVENQDGEISEEVYDRIVPIGSLKLHIRSLKKVLDQRIVARRWEYARVALMLLSISWGGAFLLVYILMNPFRKLADWVRRADHGKLQDEMDIGASSEIGEIAQAFSEITNKFRESQKNLAEQERLQKEMQVAKEIQKILLPSAIPALEGYELASYYQTALEVGGDYYDFVEVDKDKLGIVVADVSGKGIPGSLVMTMIRMALRTEARGLQDAAEVLSRVNDFIVRDMKKGMFVTIFYVIIDSKLRRLNYASAGHNPMILYRASKQKTYYLNPRGFPVGIETKDKNLFKNNIESDTIQLMEDDLILIYTDGVTEAMNARRQLFGEERLLKTFREYGQLWAKPFVEQVKEEILAFTEGNPQSDDIALVAIREKASPEKEERRRAKEVYKQILAGASIRDACESVGITTYAYYNKYKKELEQRGAENFESALEVSVEAKHIAIEDEVKIYDIIKHHPEYDAKRISEVLNTGNYGFTAIAESTIYDELVRIRLDTRQLREAFIVRSARNRQPLKQQGTPMLTLEGKIILDRGRQLEAHAATPRRAMLFNPKKLDRKGATALTEGSEITPGEPALPISNLSVSALSSESLPTAAEINENKRKQLLNRASLLFTEKKASAAITDYERIVKLYPDFKEAYIQLGDAYFRDFELEKALTALSRAIEIDPNDISAYEKRANLYLNLKQHEKALKDLEHVLQIDPRREVVRQRIERLSRQTKAGF